MVLTLGASGVSPAQADGIDRPRDAATDVRDVHLGILTVAWLPGMSSKILDAIARAEAEERAADLRKRADSWVRPLDSYTKTTSFGAGGSLWSRRHSGQDLATAVGAAVKAMHGGTVVEVGWGGAYGNQIVIKHANHTYSQYAHLSGTLVSPGQKVSTGQRIAVSGSTGNSTGPHLHIEIRTTAAYGSAIDPVAFLRDHGLSL
ncbi:M23 family metallopeptidase [Streptomyces phyllanthi]|nr:M23 family metallopeptidase [Streptomyces phyllanthi]